MPRRPELISSTQTISSQLNRSAKKMKRLKQKPAPFIPHPVNNELKLLVDPAPSSPLLNQHENVINHDENIEDDYVLLETPETDPDVYDFSFVPSINFHMRAYTPSEVYTTIAKYYAKKFSLIDTLIDAETATSIADIFDNNTHKIILFKTVSDVASTLSYYPKYWLDKVLSLYQAIRGSQENDMLIIPIAELARGHFRLLTIHQQQIHYYDSKSVVSSFLSRIIAPLKPISQSAMVPSLQVMAKKVQRSDPDNLTENLSILWLALQETGKTLGRIAYEIATRLPEHYAQVSLTCQQYFPQAVFSDLALGDQEFNDHINCGPFTTVYAKQVVNGLQPGQQHIDSLTARANADHDDDYILEDTPDNTDHQSYIARP